MIKRQKQKIWSLTFLISFIVYLGFLAQSINFRQPRNGESHKMREMISEENNNHMIVCFGEIRSEERRVGKECSG